MYAGVELRIEKLESLVARIDATLMPVAPSLSGAARGAVERWRADAAALRFHLRRDLGGKRSGAPPLLAIIGGTGTGKSTLVNRLLGRNVSAASFRRTFTSGPVAIAADAAHVPDGWLGVEHVAASEAELPARGRPGALIVVTSQTPGDTPGTLPVLVDTPDLDGDQPAHHAQADRAFRWADAVLFLVTPEKYQMTELLPYYRLAARYAVPAMFVMNKCEEAAVLQDYRRMLSTVGAIDPGSTPSSPAPRVFVVPRDDSAYQPPPEEGLGALRAALSAPLSTDPSARQPGLRHRAADLLGRLTDQVLAPLREERREADRLAAALRSMETPAIGVDVNPLTQQLQRRMQQRSILYLMGPQRILDRVRQTPGLLMRLPRVAWDYVKTGEISAGSLSPNQAGGPQAVPDFRAVLVDQFAVLQSRIDDVLRSSGAGEKWLTAAGEPPAGPGATATSASYAAAKLPAADAGRIAEEELADLKDWLEKRWNAKPRDTRALETLLKYLPGGARLAKWSEAAPYLLTVVLVTHGAVFGHIDLIVLGGYGLATWLTEKLSNEVASRTREANTRIAQRFTRLAHDQIERTCAWLDKLAPPNTVLDQLDRLSQDAAEVVG